MGQLWIWGRERNHAVTTKEVSNEDHKSPFLRDKCREFDFLFIFIENFDISCLLKGLWRKDIVHCGHTEGTVNGNRLTETSDGAKGRVLLWRSRVTESGEVYRIRKVKRH